MPRHTSLGHTENILATLSCTGAGSHHIGNQEETGMVSSDSYAFLAWTIVLCGVALAAAAAVKPFFDTGYHLQVGVLLAGLLPYLVYTVIAVMLQRPLTIVAGIALLVAHAWLVLSERFSGVVDYSSDTIYYVPVLLAVALVPLWIMAMRQPWRAQDKLERQNADT
jgi:hypothetical protein